MSESPVVPPRSGEEVQRAGAHAANVQQPARRALMPSSVRKYLLGAVLGAGVLFMGALAFYVDLNEAGAAFTAIASVVMALFTWKLTVATVAMSEGATAAAAEQREATERDQRGYVMYKGASVPSDGTLTMIWANFGRTPVKDVEPFVYWSFDEGDASQPTPSTEPPPRNVEAAKRDRVCIAPGGEYWIPCQVPGKSRRNAHAMYGGYRAFLHGHVEYTDAFGKRRRTDFRYRIDSDGNPQFCAEGSDWT